MNEEKIHKFGRDFLKLKIFPIFQKDKQFYVAKFTAKDFLSLYTVEPAEYDIAKQIAFASKFHDDKSYYDYLIAIDQARVSTKAFERKENRTRIIQIKQFLNEEKYALFPNTIIVSCDLINKYLDVSFDVKFSDLKKVEDIFKENPNSAYLEKTDDETYLYIPYVKNSILVIDGQHRITGLEESNVKHNYELLVSFIIDVDRSVLAKLFYTINYTQKSVNKSLLYHLTGEFSYELNEIKFMHETVKILNELKNSPFYKKIKMLGTIPEETPKEERKNLTISQAFLIDYLVGMISEKAKGRSIYQPIFLYQYKKDEEQIEIIRFLIKYFNAIKKKNPKSWDDSRNSIISKTVGVGAFLRVLHFFYVKLFIKDFNSDPSKIKNLKTEELIKKLGGVEKIDFSAKSEFGGVGSVGSLNKLKERILEQMSYFEGGNYTDFLSNYRKKYFEQFEKWLNKNA